MSEEIQQTTQPKQPNRPTQKKPLPVYILLRTSSRPKFFLNCYKSIQEQDYPNIVVITHIDTEKDREYAKGDMIITSPDAPRTTKGFYNLFCNSLLDAIPEGDGWYHFIDDDDKYTAPDCISRMVAMAKKDYINIARSKRSFGKVWPRTWGKQKSYQTECFFLHTCHKDKARWPNHTGGDHYYSSQLTTIHNLPVNWTDENFIICEAQIGKGHGRRLDIAQMSVTQRHESLTSYCGAKHNRDMRKIKYLEDVSGSIHVQGKKGAILWRHKDYANLLIEQDRAELKEV